MSETNYFDEVKKVTAFCDDKVAERDCMKHFDKNGDGVLDSEEFHLLCLQLFVEDGQSFPLSESETLAIFTELDDNKDGRIDAEEFHILWKYWLPMILTPKSALVVVDMQNDFLDGSLTVSGGLEVIPIVNGLIDNVPFDKIVYTHDLHPVDHISFFENLGKRSLHPSSKVKKEDAKMFDTVVFDGKPPCEQTLWPTHCVMDSHGAELHQDLKIVPNPIHINKGTCPDVDSYSCFFDNNHCSQTNMASEMCSHRITDLYFCGLAYDVCVRHSAIDGKHLGFRCVVIDDACRGVTPDGTHKAKNDCTDCGCLMFHSDQIKDMVTASTRHPVMGLTAAKNVAEARRKTKHLHGNNNIIATEKNAPKVMNGGENVEFLLDL